MDLVQSLKKKRKQILKIADKYGAYNLRIFGSVARGDADKKSDIDFLVQLEPRCRLVDWLHLEEELERLLGMRVDVVQEEALKSRIRQRVLNEAIPL